MQMKLFKKIATLREQLNSCVLGQESLVEYALIGLFTQGHILLQSVPGLAKTTLAKSLAKSLNLSFKRIQFTPDLIPSDILGAQIYNPKTQNFQTRFGAIFTNILLTDEINRAPAKVQSALLEAMGEQQVSIGEECYLLHSPFLVIATANPIESEGVYALPEAQLDRFMLGLELEYPSAQSEVKILQNAHLAKESLALMDSYDLEVIKERIEQIYTEPSLQEYIISLARATRENFVYKNISCLRLGLSPRASIDMQRAAKAYAFLQNRDYLTPSDILEVLPIIASHRILLSFEALSEGISPKEILNELALRVKIP
ncbi:AAA family ATPase [Helicobacter himalayensis]|uniref:AAA family ATPase n=1 Tax=Helicobacter himalayensis TaxID=1591088 RepID=UPI000AAB5C5E|nr:MoxR family ATPase [Helicobacter himalayensis]